MTTRRLFLLGAASLIAAPAVIRTAGLLMPIKPLTSDLVPWLGAIETDGYPVRVVFESIIPLPSGLVRHVFWTSGTLLSAVDHPAVGFCIPEGGLLGRHHYMSPLAIKDRFGVEA